MKLIFNLIIQFDVSPDWIIFGKGSILREKVEGILGDPGVSDLERELEIKSLRIKDLERTIQIQEDFIHHLKGGQ